MDAKEVTIGGYRAYSNGMGADCSAWHRGVGCEVQFLAGNPPWVCCRTCQVAVPLIEAGERLYGADSSRPTAAPPTPAEAQHIRFLTHKRTLHGELDAPEAA